MPLESTLLARPLKIKVAEAQELQDWTGLPKWKVWMQAQPPEKMAQLMASHGLAPQATSADSDQGANLSRSSGRGCVSKESWHVSLSELSGHGARSVSYPGGTGSVKTSAKTER